MVKREIIEIDENKCTGCGECVPNCAEGALQIIDGKARLISDLFCDGLGACIGHCPENAITMIEREAEKYDERKTMIERIIPAGSNTIKAHLDHMKDHGETEFLNIALDVLKEKGIDNPMEDQKMEKKGFCGCQGSKEMDFSDKKQENEESGPVASQLRQWPIQFHLINPMAPYFQKKDVLLAADCTAFSLGSFHNDQLKGKSLIIACPKLDSDQEIYIEKLVSLIDEAEINTLTVAIMEVPCCGGLAALAKTALDKATRKIPIKKIVVGIKGDILSEDWM